MSSEQVVIRLSCQIYGEARALWFQVCIFLQQWGNCDFRAALCYFHVNMCFHNQFTHIMSSASVAQLDAPSDWRPGGRGFSPRRGRQHSFVEIDHEIFSTVILSLPLIQEGQLSVSGERMCTILIIRLED